MKRYLPIFWLLSMVLSTDCKKSIPGYMATASIIGADPRVPACGGGTWIQIDGHPNPGTSTGYYDIGKTPSGFRNPTSATYPVRVEMDYTINPNCSIYVDISRIHLIN